eukprot:CAMPEP_0117423462 /NCGR_PEP_ID=MMETSP0758-20121206/4074_1 /TAXON_ID=63605 /ORGANISM="Percolomonas cosmopolitus, Strain AE-1 (ATCC 50343)" /LENGTH=555 /DNA_ID=CAMNT_0005206651 /DNA_START=940 /DNA_END=2607 /DNA_ORIENTATION=-
MQQDQKIALDDLFEPKIPPKYTQLAGRQPAPLEMIDPYMSGWVTCVRVVDRFPIREFKRRDGTPGKLMTLELKDLRGFEMVATLFSEAVDKFDKLIEVNQTYYITNAKIVKAKNLKYTRIKSPFQMTIRLSTLMIPCEDNGLISKGEEAKLLNHFKELKELPDKSEVTLTGVVRHASDLFTITTNKGTENERHMKKRDLYLVDLLENRPYLIKINLWESQSKMKAKVGSIIRVTNLRVGTYNNSTSLTASRKTDILEENPSDIRFASLVSWFRDNPKLSHEQMECICDVGDNPFRKARGLPGLISHITSDGLGADPEKSDFINVKAYVQPIEINYPIYYPCCTTCGKKVRQQSETSPFECAQCGFTVEDPGYKYMIRMTLCDASGETQATAFDSVCTNSFFKISALDMKSLFESNEAEDISEAETYVRQLSLSQFEFTLAVSRRRDDETQQSINIIKAIPTNFYVDSIRKSYRDLLHALNNFDPDPYGSSSSNNAPLTVSELPVYPSNNYHSQYPSTFESSNTTPSHQHPPSTSSSDYASKPNHFSHFHPKHLSS